MMDVSIIVPAYCQNDMDIHWLGECLDSACVQDCDVVVWDDGSPIDLVPIRREFPDVRWYRHNINMGPSAARNSAAATAHGPLLFPLDCDDVLQENAISKLVNMWEGVPLYPDIYKFGSEDVPHYVLLDFMCEHILTKVGIASIGVLHSKEQWHSIGGWDERLDFYEDGEYNARLMLRYCGRHIREPLYGYRQHESQRTVLNEQRSQLALRKVLSMVQEYERSLGMSGCPGCGRRRTSQDQGSSIQNVQQRRGNANNPPRSLNQRIGELPGADGGKAHAVYIGGKGRGRHYYRGPATRFAYKVKHGDVVANVDIRDTSDPDDPNHAQISLLVRVNTPPTPPTPPVKEPVPLTGSREAVRRSKVAVERVAVSVENDVIEGHALPDISSITYRQLVTMDFAPDIAAKLLLLEEGGRNRVKHVAYLKRRVKSDS